MKSERVIRFIETMRQHGIKEAVAKEILSLLDEREGDHATKADLEQAEKRLEASIDQLRIANRKDIERLESGLKGNRWSTSLLAGGLATVVIGGFGLLLTVMIYLNSQANERIDKIEAEIGKIESELKEIKELIRESRPTAQATIRAQQ